MSQSLQPDPMLQRIIDFVPLLVELGRKAERSVLAEALLPNAWDFGVLWKQWDRVVGGWKSSEVADLIKGLTYFESMFDRGFGSVPPVANLFRIYSSMVDETERDQFADWILRNTVNDYTPFGTNNYGTRNLKDLQQRQAELLAQKQAVADSEKARFDDSRRRKIIQATEQLPNALRRRDIKAVVALIAKGADPDELGISGQSARAIAFELGVSTWLSSRPQVNKQEN